MTEPCKPCNRSFAREHQSLIDDVCYLKEIITADKFVRTSDDDPQSGYLADKITGVSGVSIIEMTDGPSGNILVASVDFPVLDYRYLSQPTTLNLGLNEGVHNGYVGFNRIGGAIQSLRWSTCGNASSSWNVSIPSNFSNIKDAKLNIAWTNDGVSGTVIFNVEYNSVGIGGSITMFNSEIVSGISDGTVYKLYESSLDLNTFTMNPEDQFFLRIKRLTNSLSDNLAGPIEIIGVRLGYNF